MGEVEQAGVIPLVVRKEGEGHTERGREKRREGGREGGPSILIAWGLRGLFVYVFSAIKENSRQSELSHPKDRSTGEPFSS